MTQADDTLAIFTPTVGDPSETFIRRHLIEILPGRTVAIAGCRYSPNYWSVSEPCLVLGERSIAERVRVRIIRAAGLQVNSHERAIVGFLRRHRVSVILSEWLDVGLAWLPIARRLGIPFYAHAHGYDVAGPRMASPEVRDAYQQFNGAAGVITINEPSRDRLIECGLARDKVHVVPYGVDVSPEPIQHSTAGTVRCLAVGRMVTKKAPILLLDAFRRALDVYPDMHLDYVGAGELLPAARQFVGAFGLCDRVSLHGVQPNQVVGELMERSDIFVQHSIVDVDGRDEEGLPVAILEAMAHGLPVVSTLHAGIPEAVEHGVSGMLVQEGDTKGMAQFIAHLAGDQAERERMGHAGWEIAAARFTVAHEVARLREIIFPGREKNLPNETAVGFGKKRDEVPRY